MPAPILQRYGIVGGYDDPAGLVVIGGQTDFYTTTFPLTENPISESGTWIHQSVGNKTIQTTGGNAVLVAATDNTDDGYAYISTATFNKTNYRIDATIFKSSTGAREIALSLRMGDASDRVFGYECLINVDNNSVQIMRWNNVAGPPINFTDIGTSYVPTAVNDGDVIRATAIGSSLAFYHQPGGAGGFNQIAVATDSTFQTGQPGFSAFMATGFGTLGTWGLKDYTVIAL